MSKNSLSSWKNSEVHQCRRDGRRASHAEFVKLAISAGGGEMLHQATKPTRRRGCDVFHRTERMLKEPEGMRSSKGRGRSGRLEKKCKDKARPWEDLEFAEARRSSDSRR